jgi:hypothetical protein
MVFAQPLFLIALSALAIPVIIHLFNFRRYRKVYFTNVRFLSEIRQESKKRSELKHLLILLMRLLAIASLVMAFARPYIPSSLYTEKLKNRNAVSIYVDNSFSMEALSSQGPLLDVARKKALEIADAYGPSDLFQLLTNDFEGRHQRFVSRDEFRSLLDEVRFSPAVHSLPEVVRRQGDLLKGERNANLAIYLISDFQKSTTDPGDITPERDIPCFFIPVEPEKTGNLYIDSAWFENPVQMPGQATRLAVRVRNISGDLLEKIPLQLTINNSQKAIASVSVEPEGMTDVVMPFTNSDEGIQWGTLSVTDYPVTWDDRLYFTYRINPIIPVLCIRGTGPEPYLDAFFRGDSAFVFRAEDIGRLDYSSFGEYPLLILDSPGELSTGLIEELTRYVHSGGNLLVFPDRNPPLTSYDTLATALGSPSPGPTDTTSFPIAWVNTESRLFTDVFEKNASGKVVLPDNVDMPVIRKHYRLTINPLSLTEDLLKLQNGDPLLVQTPSGKGRVYTCAVPLDDSWSNFPKHALFVPVMFRIALLSQPTTPIYYDLSSVTGIEVRSDSVKDNDVYRIRKNDSGFEVIPGMKSAGISTLLFLHGQIPDAGFYTVMQGNRIVCGIAFNYNRKESDLRCHQPSELESQLKQAGVKRFSVLKPGAVPLTRLVADLGKGIPLWKYFIFAALAFLLAEVMFARFLKE